MGEGFDYWGSTPEWWLLETSGLPFGITGDMIREGTTGGTGPGKGCPDPNRWLGMVFGMGTRLGFGTPLGANVTAAPNVQEVVPVWQFWKQYSLADSEMVGWWSDPADLLVTTSDPDVKATAFALRHENTVVVALANFGNATKSVTLSFSPAIEVTGQIEAPAVEAYQPARTFAAAEPVPCASKRGWLLVVGAKFKLSHRPGSRTLRHV